MANKRKSSSRKSRSKKGATLLQLQKLAKAHNIKVTGLKKSSVKAKLRSHGVTIPRRKSVKSSAKKCKSGQTLNKSTGRCRKSPSKKSRSGKKSSKKCKSGQTLNRSTGRCRKSPSKKSRSGKKSTSSSKKSKKKSSKKCKSGQTLNRSTGRCRTKCKPGQKRNSQGICK